MFRHAGRARATVSEGGAIPGRQAGTGGAGTRRSKDVRQRDPLRAAVEQLNSHQGRRPFPPLVRARRHPQSARVHKEGGDRARALMRAI